MVGVRKLLACTAKRDSVCGSCKVSLVQTLRLSGRCHLFKEILSEPQFLAAAHLVNIDAYWCACVHATGTQC